MLNLSFWNLSLAFDANMLLQATIAIIMFNIGLSLKLNDFRFVLQNKYMVVFGLFVKLGLIPLLVLLVLTLSGLPIVWKFGILLLFLCPGGSASNVITYWFNGNSVLTIILTMLSGFITILTLPYLTNQASIYFFGTITAIKLPVLSTSLKIFTITILPTAIGLLIQTYYPKAAKQLERVLKPGSVILLGLVYLIKFFTPSQPGDTIITFTESVQLLPILFALNVICLLTGYLLSQKIRLPTAECITIGVEMGIQNVALAILIGDVYLANYELSKPALLYGLISFWITTVFAYWTQRQGKGGWLKGH